LADVHAAHLIHREAGDARLAVEARLLARQQPQEIAALVGLSTAVVETYEALFFAVSDSMAATDWIVTRAVGWAPGWPGRPDPTAVLKWFAFAGGPRVLEAVWPYLVRPSLAAAGLPPLRDGLDLRARRAAALALLPEGHAEDAGFVRHHLAEMGRDRGVPAAGARMRRLAHPGPRRRAGRGVQGPRQPSRREAGGQERVAHAVDV
jgi:hypothetical protein